MTPLLGRFSSLSLARRLDLYHRFLQVQDIEIRLAGRAIAVDIGQALLVALHQLKDAPRDEEG